MPLIATNPNPRVILGLMTFGPDTNAGARITSLPEYNTVLDHFQAAGYNEVDTARTYVGGKQEAFTREAKWKDRGLMIATKLYPSEPGKHRPDVLVENFNTSLKELGADCVDIFYLHAADRSVPFAETLEAVDKLHKQGKFVQLGLSNFTAFEVAEVVMTCHYNKWVRPTIYQGKALDKIDLFNLETISTTGNENPDYTSVQINHLSTHIHKGYLSDVEVSGMYNAITRSLEQELIPACHRYGLDVVVYNPIAGGLFSGKYKTRDIPTEGRYSDASGRIGEMYRKRYFKDSTFEALKIIEPVVEKHGLTMIETALRWIIHHSALNIAKGGHDGVIIGVSSVNQLDENLRDCKKGPLPREVLEALDKAWLVSKPETPNYWHLDLKYAYDTRKALFGK